MDFLTVHLWKVSTIIPDHSIDFIIIFTQVLNYIFSYIIKCSFDKILLFLHSFLYSSLKLYFQLYYQMHTLWRSHFILIHSWVHVKLSKWHNTGDSHISIFVIFSVYDAVESSNIWLKSPHHHSLHQYNTKDYKLPQSALSLSPSKSSF